MPGGSFQCSSSFWKKPTSLLLLKTSYFNHLPKWKIFLWSSENMKQLVRREGIKKSTGCSGEEGRKNRISVLEVSLSVGIAALWCKWWLKLRMSYQNYIKKVVWLFSVYSPYALKNFPFPLFSWYFSLTRNFRIFVRGKYWLWESWVVFLFFLICHAQRLKKKRWGKM